MKIISTVPSITELLSDLDLDDEVVGITKFCVHPERWYRSKPRIGGTKTLNLEKIIALQPDLIIANKEENTKEQIEALSMHAEVYVTEIKTLEDNVELIRYLGRRTQRTKQATQLIGKLESAIAAIHKTQMRSVAYLIWQDPMMTIGGDTFINNMLMHCGWQNVFADHVRYPEINMAHLKKHNPGVLMLSSEPFPFKEKHLQYYRQAMPDTQVLLVDGEAFSWYGSRLLKKAEYLKSLQV